MENKQLLPFERNRFYVGKLLTSADFSAEQTYFNNKRRFQNSIMYGDGIICGFGVYGLDDQSIAIESGVAYDNWGREIVIEKSIVRKLSAIDGFDQLKTSEAALCLRYAEDKVHSVYAVSRSEREQPEFNRISESYELFLMDTKEADKVYRRETEFLTRGILFTHDAFRIEIEIPAVVCKGRPVKLVARAVKTSAENRMLNYSCILQIPGFISGAGTHEVEVVFENLKLENAENVCREFWLQVQQSEAPETDIVLKTGTATARLDDNYADAAENVSLKVELSEIQPRYLIADKIGKVSLELRNMERQEAWVRLADIRLSRNESTYLIDQISEKKARKYVQAPADEMLRREYMDYFLIEQDTVLRESRGKEEAPVHAERGGNRPEGIEIATGTLEIPLGDHVRRGDIRYSGEIMHGLGKGNVYVEIGYECIEQDRAVGANTKSTIYGNPNLFQNDKENLLNVETAVKVLNDKGSFVVAARLARDVDFLVLTYQWVAMKFPTGNDMGETSENRNQSIQAETPTVVLRAKESYYFGVRFSNMEKCSIAYELSESGSGEITSDGVYTAPNKEGVYEIRIYCTDNPIICTYAYAIVKKNNADIEPEN